MKYVDHLKSIFKKWNSAHFILATHSHFIVSDLEGESSTVIGLTGQTPHVSIELFDYNTYGWSAEDVLYNVFDVASTRNKFVAEDIANILNQLSNGQKDKENIIPKELFDKIISLQTALKDNDPLKTVVNSILKKIK